MFRKIIKGTLAIFAIKLVLITGIFVFQSCQSDTMDNEIETEAKNNFLSSLNLTNQKLRSVPIKNSKGQSNNEIMNRIIEGDTETVCLQFLGDDAPSDQDVINDLVDNISTLTDVIQAKTNHNILTQFDFNTVEDGEDDGADGSSEYDFNPEDCIALIEIPIQPVADALEPAIEEAKNYLISEYGFSNQEINEMIANEIGQEEDLVPLVMAMVNAENSTNGTAFNYMSLFGESAYAQDWEQIGNCAMVAIGADILYSLATADPAMGSKWTKKAIKKAFGVVAKRMLGPIGVAIAVVSFALCMSGN